MAHNFLEGTTLWNAMSERQKRFFQFAFETLQDDYARVRGDAVRFQERGKTTWATADKYLSVVVLIVSLLRDEGGSGIKVKEQAEGGDTNAKEATHIAESLGLTWAQIEGKKNEKLSENVATPAEGEAQEKSGLSGLFTAAEENLRILKSEFLLLVNQLETLRQENVSFRDRIRLLEKQNTALDRILEAKEYRLVQLRGEIDRLFVSGESETLPKEEQSSSKDIILIHGFPLETADVQCFGNRKIPIHYASKFLKAFEMLHPDQKKLAVEQIKSLADKGKRETESSQQHKFYTATMITVPKNSVVSRVSKKIRYVWGIEGKTDQRALVVYYIGQHNEIWPSET